MKRAIAAVLGGVLGAGCCSINAYQESRFGVDAEAIHRERENPGDANNTRTEVFRSFDGKREEKVVVTTADEGKVSSSTYGAKIKLDQLPIRGDFRVFGESGEKRDGRGVKVNWIRGEYLGDFVAEELEFANGGRQDLQVVNFGRKISLGGEFTAKGGWINLDGGQRPRDFSTFA